MAQKRMFSLAVTDTDKFLDMPTSTQVLYFHLGMHGDDDGFVSSPKKIARGAGCNDDDLRLLAAKGYIIPFESGVIVIADWGINNTLKNDRYHTTVFTAERALVSKDGNGRWVFGSNMEQDRNQLGSSLEPEHNVTKRNIELSSELADREPDKSESKERAKKLFPPDSDAYLAACCLRDEIAARLPTSTPPSEKQLQAWAAAFDKCHRLDGHDWDEIERVLLFSQSDKFWQQNILSGDKFRKQYTALLARMGGG